MSNILKTGNDGMQRAKEIENISSFLASLNNGRDVLKGQPNDIPFQEYLNVISPVSSADRTYIFLNHSGASGENLTSCIAEWCREGNKSEIDNAAYQNINYLTSFPHFYEVLSSGKQIVGNLKDLPDKERDFLDKRNVRWVALSPLESAGDFNGFIGFDNCSLDNIWSDVDIEYLKAVTQNLSSCIEENWVLSRLKLKNSLFCTVMDAMDVIIYAADIETHEVVYMNKHAESEFGDGRGKKCWNVLYKDKTKPCSFCPKEKILLDETLSKKPYVWEHYYPKVSKWFMNSTQLILWPDGRTVIFQILTDLTKHKETEKKLSNLIEEKDSLLNEVNHRVKNNLQSLVYLISMQADYIDNPKAKEIIKEIKERVNAMSLVHSQLYQSKNLASIDFEKYVSDLVSTLIRSLAIEKINTIINIRRIDLDIKNAIPCGLIINELVTNIIKHAFSKNDKAGQSPEISISMEKVSGRYILKVGDNGGGFSIPVNFLQHKSSLGLKLVKIWATHQLRGTVDINEKSGVEFIISFPE